MKIQVHIENPAWYAVEVVGRKDLGQVFQGANAAGRAFQYALEVSESLVLPAFWHDGSLISNRELDDLEMQIYWYRLRFKKTVEVLRQSAVEIEHCRKLLKKNGSYNKDSR